MSLKKKAKPEPKRELTVEEITSTLDDKINSLYALRESHYEEIKRIEAKIATIVSQVKGIGNNLNSIVKKIKDF